MKMKSKTWPSLHSPETKLKKKNKKISLDHAIKSIHVERLW